MIEIRKLLKTKGGKYLSVQLQYRYVIPSIDAAGNASYKSMVWSDWFDVLDIFEDENQEFIPENKRAKMENFEDENDDDS